MIPGDWAFECWGFLTFVMANGRGVVWSQDQEQVAQQDAVLARDVLPLLCSGQWFFRRLGLRDEVPRGDLPDSVAVYVRLARGLPRADPCRDLRHLSDALGNAGHRVVGVGDWDRCFGGGYGGPLGQAALREFCCEVAAAHFGSGDPYEVADAWLREGTACAHGIVHWLSWIVGEPDELSLRVRLRVQ